MMFLSKINKGSMTPLFYLLQIYIVTSKPKRISVAVGLVHIAILLSLDFILNFIPFIKINDEYEMRLAS
jgi:hypothetical protein